MDATARSRTAVLVIDTQIGFRHTWHDASATVARIARLRAITEGFDVVLVGDAHTTGDAQVGSETMSGAAIIGHTNLSFAGINYPGRTVTVERYDAVELR